MVDVLSFIKEIWLCEPTCECEHSAMEVSSMLGIFMHNLREIRRLGLRPSGGGSHWSEYIFRCQDVQRFAYDIEKPIGINYYQSDPVRKRAESMGILYSTAPYRYRQAVLAERKMLVRPPPRLPVEQQYVKVIRPGYVYLLHWNGLYKIGMSINVKRRVVGLAGVPATIDIVHTVKTKDMSTAEKFLHRRFAQYRIKGKHREWFSLPDDAVAWIRALRSRQLAKEIQSIAEIQ
jgi:hypothetical protein